MLSHVDVSTLHTSCSHSFFHQKPTSSPLGFREAIFLGTSPPPRPSQNVLLVQKLPEKLAPSSVEALYLVYLFAATSSHPAQTYMGVSTNNDTPKSFILIGENSIINHPFWGTPIFGNIHIDFIGKTLLKIPSKTFMQGICESMVVVFLKKSNQQPNSYTPVN